MQRLPLVSVCVPTVGRLEYLQRSLASLRAQTYLNVEILILDNASDEKAQGVLEEFVASTPAARVLRVDVRVPMFANFNRGIRAARGDYVVFFHDDDVYASTFIERLVGLMEQHPSAGFAGSNFDLISGKGEVLRQRNLVGRTELWSGREFIEAIFQRGRSPFSTPGLMFRREVLARVEFDEAIPIHWGDFTILSRMAETHDVAAMADSLFAWRVHDENNSRMPQSRAMVLRTQVLGAYCDEYHQRHPGDAAFVARLRQQVTRLQWIGLLWGWISGVDEADAAACREMLKASAPSPLVGGLLVLEKAGFSLARRRAVLPALRRIGTMLGA